MRLFPAVVTIAVLASVARSESLDRYCQVQSQIGEKVMEARQSGTPMSRLIEINQTLTDSPDERRLYDEIVIRAYEEPLLRSDRNKAVAITEFGNHIMVSCLRGGQSVNR